METSVQIVEKMEHVLDQLVTNAEALKDLSLKEFSEQAATPLQEKQAVLIQQLEELEIAFEAADKEGQEEELAKAADRIAKKLRYFQHLNATFIENITEGNIVQDIWEEGEKPKVPEVDFGIPRRTFPEEPPT